MAAGERRFTYATDAVVTKESIFRCKVTDQEVRLGTQRHTEIADHLRKFPDIQFEELAVGSERLRCVSQLLMFGFATASADARKFVKERLVAFGLEQTADPRRPAWRYSSR